MFVWMVDMKNLASKSLGLEGIRMPYGYPSVATSSCISVGELRICQSLYRAFKGSCFDFTSWMDMAMMI